MSTKINKEEAIDVEAVVSEPLAIDREITYGVVTTEEGNLVFPLVAQMHANYQAMFEPQLPENYVVKDDEDYKRVRQIGTDARAEANTNDSRRIAVRKQITEEFDSAMDQYKETSGKYLSTIADRSKKALSAYDSAVLKNNEAELRVYYANKVKGTILEKIEFITYDTLSISIVRSKTMTALRKEVDTLVDRYLTELQSISMMSDKELVLDEYKKTLDLSQSINKVEQMKENARRVKELEDQRIAREEEARLAREALATEPVVASNPVPHTNTPTQAVTTPQQAPTAPTQPIAPAQPDVLSAIPPKATQLKQFTLVVRGTDDTMKQAVALMQQAGIDFSITKQVVEQPLSIGDI